MYKKSKPLPKQKTSWGHVAKWYDNSVKERGHYYHTHLVLPNVLQLLYLKDGDSLLDLACGQGVLARRIPKTVSYTGVDISDELISTARKYDTAKNHTYFTGDVTKGMPYLKEKFTHASIVLALQNIDKPILALKNASEKMETGGRLVVVLNHPCFRIPRQSGWEVDEHTKTQKRWINRYLSSLTIPINMHPSKQNRGAVTWSFHFSLSTLSIALQAAGFVIEKIEELASDKRSEGTAAKMENTAREEIPLFMSLLCRKVK